MTQDYKIYFAPDCHECETVQLYIDEHNISIETEILDKDSRGNKGVFIFPALLKGDEIIAYGKDIIKYLV